MDSIHDSALEILSSQTKEVRDIGFGHGSPACLMKYIWTRSLPSRDGAPT
jgi:hypothetical protein